MYRLVTAAALLAFPAQPATAQSELLEQLQEANNGLCQHIFSPDPRKIKPCEWLGKASMETIVQRRFNKEKTEAAAAERKRAQLCIDVFAPDFAMILLCTDLEAEAQPERDALMSKAHLSGRSNLVLECANDLKFLTAACLREKLAE